ncbi:MAG: hypothetical protein KDN05_05625 [Verrucomicrobiae bacterium]|nr:hypothetical protein [Verrucomicrobiae bacterium]
MKRAIPLLATALLASCAADRAPLVVKTYQLRDQEREPDADPMARMEKHRRLLGAVSLEQRRGRLGQYYTVLWNDPAAGTPVTVTFEYQQGGSRVKRMTRDFPADAVEGRAEFAITGDDYSENGRVLAWHVTLERGGNELASRQSYLWR